MNIEFSSDFYKLEHGFTLGIAFWKADSHDEVEVKTYGVTLYFGFYAIALTISVED